MDAPTKEPLDFCRELPKIECHAHLNGSIPQETVDELIRIKTADGSASNHDLLNFSPPDSLAALEEFFPLFSKVIYRLTDTPDTIKIATLAVLNAFHSQNVMYLELRTTPRINPETSLTISTYLSAVSEALEEFSSSSSGAEMQARLILSLDWRHEGEMLDDIVDTAIQAKRRDGKGWVVGVDVCGDPSKSDGEKMRRPLKRAKEAGLKVTVHFGEIPAQVSQLESHLALSPDRLGHATFLTPFATQYIIKQKIPIEICITSNVLAKTVPSAKDHHISWAVENGVPILICTDDMLIFRNTSISEYAIALSLLSGPRELLELLVTGVDATFAEEDTKDWMRSKLEAFSRLQI